MPSISAINNNFDCEIALIGFFRSIRYGIVAAALFFILGSMLFWLHAPAKSVYADTEQMQFLTKIPGYDSPKYLISTESLETGENYTFYLNNGQELQTIPASSIRIVTDNPARPFVAEIKHTCEGDKLWVLYCLNPSPYKLEIHVPPDSIILVSP